MSWSVSSYASYLPTRALELKFKGMGRMGRPRRRWFSQLLEYKKLARNYKLRTEDLRTIDPHKMETMVE